jgi:hypothetical protein
MIHNSISGVGLDQDLSCFTAIRGGMNSDTVAANAAML